MHKTTKRLPPLPPSFACSSTAPQHHTLTGHIHVHKRFPSGILRNHRDVIVYLPPDYDVDKRKKYPILYLQDGQNLFDGTTSFTYGQEWRVDETAQSLIEAGKIEPLIIVGIYNAGHERTDEYTPTHDAKRKTGGKAELYGRMLIDELKPFIDANYRTLNHARHTGLGGSSLGGLVSLYLGLKHPEVFSRLAVVSPSVWFDDKTIVRYVEALTKRPNVRIWLDTGTKEGGSAEESQETVANARLLLGTLIRKGWKLGRDLIYFEKDDAEHNENAWAARVEPMLQFLFPRR
jgi:predicted alpha/beta superfamily hydrolase